MKNSVLWYITPCSPLKVYRRFGRICRFWFSAEKWARLGNRHGNQSFMLVSCLACYSTLKMEMTFPPKRRLYPRRWNCIFVMISVTTLFWTDSLETHKQPKGKCTGINLSRIMSNSGLLWWRWRVFWFHSTEYLDQLTAELVTSELVSVSMNFYVYIYLSKFTDVLNLSLPHIIWILPCLILDCLHVHLPNSSTDCLIELYFQL
jgi:hypothetical protein